MQSHRALRAIHLFDSHVIGRRGQRSLDSIAQCAV
jgi:hypothetical protein